MPSVSKKQHNLMEAVAHNPGFAKKVGIPQKVGKHFHEADKMKRKKKFDDGGPAIDVGKLDLDSGSMPDHDLGDDMSFKDRFAYARKSGDKTFKWRGKSYTTDVAPAKAAPAKPAPIRTTGPIVDDDSRFVAPPGARGGYRGEAPIKPGTYSNYAKDAAKFMGTGMAALGAGPELVTGRALSYASMTPSEIAAAARAGRPMREILKELSSRGIGYKKGGKVKHANELEGKAKETKSIAHEEMKALKRGHAPKEIMEHEKAEHKAMGYKKGGKIETPKKGYAMAETKGGRKPPHGKHTSEGDTKLKGFGMGKGLGHGRTVKKSSAGSQETNRKGFAMKKGGHVKHMKGGGMSKRKMGQMSPSAATPGLPSGLAGALGGQNPAGTMMKGGGHVSHHHHHHYAKGGHVKAGHRNEDGIAQRGHTRAKHVKMASGGHVGSHPSRRGDGMAHKGHTRCKIV